jgi:hypothetical protein
MATTTPGGRPRAWALGAPHAALAGVLIVTAASLLAFDARVRPALPPGGLRVRLMHHAHVAGEAIGTGLLVALILALRARFGPRRRILALLPLLAASLATSIPLLPEDAVSFCARLGQRVSPELIRDVIVVIAAVSVPLSVEIGVRLGRLGRAGRGAGVLGAVAMAAASHHVLPGGYASAHLFLALSAVALAGGSLAGAEVPWVPPAWARRTGVVVLALWGAAMLLHPPRGDIAREAYRSPGTLLQPLLARLRDHAPPPPPPDRLPPDMRPRDGAPPVAPTTPRPLPAVDTVILLSLDALRADVPDRHAERLPNLTRLRRASLDLTQARSPGSETLYTFTSLFAGKYFCELSWTPLPHLGLWPHEDPTARFPALLGEAGVDTVALDGISWLTNPFGVASGFRTNLYLRTGTGREFTTSRALMPNVVRRLEQAPAEGPLFLWAHLLDAHEPYDLGGTEGTLYERYVREVEVADRAVGQLLDAIDRSPRAGRTMLVLTADHGEAFGEHETWFHGTTLYEELIRVPLWIRAPGVAPRRDDTPVTVLDLGPTILDVFGVATPGSSFGQTLAPLLAGRALAPSRPIAAETRRIQAIVFPDRTKVICDRYRGTLEVYDLGADPGEMHNLASGDTAPFEEKIRLCWDFFDTIRLRRPGDETPFRY